MDDLTEGALALKRFFESRSAPSKGEVADDCGIPASSIAAILSGDRRPTIDQAAELKKKTKIPIEAWARR